MSVIGNDVWGCEVRKVNIWFKHQRVRIAFLHAPLRVAIQREVELLTTMRALAINLDRQLLVT